MIICNFRLFRIKTYFLFYWIDLRKNIDLLKKIKVLKWVNMKWLMMSHLAREWYLGRIHFIFFSAIRFCPLLLNFSVRGTNLSVAHGRGVDGGGSSTVRIRPFLRNLNVRLRPRTGVAWTLYHTIPIGNTSKMSWPKSVNSRI